MRRRNKNSGSAALLMLGLFLCLSGCGKTPTSTDPPNPTPSPPAQPSISVTCSPTSGGKDTVVTLTISVKNTQKEIGVFGLEMIFPPKMFNYSGVEKGSLTNDWAAVDGNKVSSDKLKIGGFKGSGTAAGANTSGSLAVVKMKVTGGQLGNGQQGKISIQGYTDDISGISPQPASTTFTLNK
jgi:hypothetical protein